MRSVMLFFAGAAGALEGVVEGPETELLREGTTVELCIELAGEVRRLWGVEVGSFIASESAFSGGSSGIVIDEDGGRSIGDPAR